MGIKKGETMINFYDFEVYKYDWLVVIINPVEQTETVIVNDLKKLEKYYKEKKEEIWVGYNSRHYDQYILKALLCGFNAWDMNDYIINKGRAGYSFSKLLQDVFLINYDVALLGKSLKQLEGFQGNNIHESDVDFKINRKLTAKEIDETIKYCRNDVLETINVFIQKKNEFDAQLSLVKTFNLSLDNIGKTQAQLASIILDAKKFISNDEWDIRIPDKLILNKYNYVADWFLNKKNHNDDAFLTCYVDNVEHVFAWGGVHGAIPQYKYTCKSDELLIMIDVDQLYPTLMIKYKLLSRAVKNYDRFEHILSESLRLKALELKNEREPYKRICNITYGCEGDKTNPMFDSRNRKLVCVFGQLLILDLIEKIEDFTTLIQSNTDGILILVKRKDFEKLDDIVFDWEERVGLNMSFEFFKTIIQKDVNNYIAIPFGELYDKKGKPRWKSKGAYVKSLNSLDNDLPIVNTALINYFVHSIPVEKTINDCDELIKFQKICKLTSKFDHVKHNEKIYKNKCYRIFASNDKNDGTVYKYKNGRPFKFQNTSENSFIDNSNVKNKKVPKKLNKKWYIDLAKERLNQFGEKEIKN